MAADAPPPATRSKTPLRAVLAVTAVLNILVGLVVFSTFGVRGSRAAPARTRSLPRWSGP